MEADRNYSLLSYIFLLLLILAVIYAMKTFIAAILLGILFYYLLEPIYSGFFRLISLERTSSPLYRFLTLMNIKRTSSILAILSGLLIFIIILYIIILIIYADTTKMIESQIPFNESLYDQFRFLDNYLNSTVPSPFSQLLIYTIEGARSIITIWLLPLAVKNLIESFFLPIAMDSVLHLASNLPMILLQIVVAVLFTYYALMDGKEIALRVTELLPETKNALARHYMQELNCIYRSLLRVNFYISFFNGVIAFLGFYVIGIPFPVFWALIVTIMTLFRPWGPAIAFISLSICYFTINDYLRALALIVFGLIFLIWLPETLLLHFIRDRSPQVHSFLAILAYLAPIFVFGILGIIIGPILYGLLMAAYKTLLYFQDQKLGQ